MRIPKNEEEMDEDLIPLSPYYNNTRAAELRRIRDLDLWREERFDAEVDIIEKITTRKQKQLFKVEG